MWNLLLFVASSAAADFDAASMITSAVSEVQGQLLDVLTVVVPALAIVTGAVVAVRFAVKWLRSLGKG